MDPEEHREVSRRGGEASGGNVENLRNQGSSRSGDDGIGLHSLGGASRHSRGGSTGEEE